MNEDIKIAKVRAGEQSVIERLRAKGLLPDGENSGEGGEPLSIADLAKKAAIKVAEFDSEHNGSWYCTHEQTNIARIVRETFAVLDSGEPLSPTEGVGAAAKARSWVCANDRHEMCEGGVARCQCDCHPKLHTEAEVQAAYIRGLERAAVIAKTDDHHHSSGYRCGRGSAIATKILRLIPSSGEQK